jgi:SM-20-related protein
MLFSSSISSDCRQTRVSAFYNASMNEPFDSVVDEIIRAVAEQGFYVGGSIFDERLTQSLQARALTLHEHGALREAKIGRRDTTDRNASIRTDHTRWLDDAPTDSVERAAVDAVFALRSRLNEALYIGAAHAELHFAHYEAGAFYKTHRDRFADNDARIISLVFYLNDDWPSDAGGELVLYEGGSDATTSAPLRELRRVSPRAGTMVAFRSEMFPHEVLPATRDRFSLTGWLRRGETL